MVSFGAANAGYSPMDREYGQHGHNHQHGSPAAGSTNDVGMGLADFGMSLALGPVPNVSLVKSKLHAGTKKLEFVFTGMHKGGGSQQTPEQYGKKQREALAEIGRANKVDFTTHATVGVYGLAGMQEGGFSKTAKNMSVQEIKRAIEFAADVGQGGPVVVHTGEYQRPILDAEWNQKDGDPWKAKFQMHEKEDERTTYRVVDNRGGNMLIEARKNRKVARPIWHVASEGKTYFEVKDGKKVERKASGAYDEEGLPIYLDYLDNRIAPEERVPEFDEDKQRFKVELMDWKELEKEAENMTKLAKNAWQKFKRGETSESDFKNSRWGRFAETENLQDIKIKAEEAYVISSLETNAANSRGWAVHYGGNFQESIDNLKKLEKALEFYKQIESTTDEEEKWRLKREVGSILPGLIPGDAELPTDLIRKRMDEVRRHIDSARESASSQWTQAKDQEETIKHVESAENYALKEACDAYARSALFAMQHSDKLAQEGKLKKPLAIAMENLFPESYGAHPDELIKLVLESRKAMMKILTDPKEGFKMNTEQAAKEAHEHITATFDTGHLNMWRKYWRGDPNKSISDNDKEFDKWSVQKLGEMIDADVVGHVHLDDNYGYQDDHLAPGEGNTPIKAMVELMKKKKYKGVMIVEPGADYYTDVSGFHSVMKTWRLFGSPVYGGGSGMTQKRSWNEVGYGFFGQNQPPYFVFGAYSPSEDWTLWSGVPLE